MKEIFNQCKLTAEQRKVILRAIKLGKKKFESLCSEIGPTTTKKHQSALQYDLINTYVEESVKTNKRILNMEVYKKQSGFHPYIVLHDYIRNIHVLVLKLPNQKELFDPSEYRGEYAASNADRLIEHGFNLEDLPPDYIHQYSLSLGAENQPFGIIVCYDGYREVVYEGALRPDQQDWLYKEEITDYINYNSDNVTRLDFNNNENEIELTWKDQDDKEEIELKFK